MARVRIGAHWASIVVGLGVLVMPAAGSESSTGRLSRIEEDIAQTSALLADTTNSTERAQWQRRLELLQQDRSNLQVRFALDAQEQELAIRQKRNATFALRQALRNIDVNTAAAQREVARLNDTIRDLRTQHAELEKSRPPDTPAGDTAEQQAESDQRIRLLDEEIAARTQEREALDVRLRLIGEAMRIEESLRTQQAVNPRLTLRLLRDKQRQLAATQKEVSDQGDVIALGLQRRQEIAAALALSRQRVATVDAEIDLLGKKNQGLKNWFKSRLTYFAATTEKKHQAQRVLCQEQQLAAVDDSIALNKQLRELYEKEAACVTEELGALAARYRHSLMLPAGLMGGILLVYLVLCYVILPLRRRKETLIVGRRLAAYLSVLAAFVVFVVFFFDDLKSVATLLGLAGAAVVIALQDMCSAIAGWFVIMATRKVAVGQRVQIDDQKGDVLDIELLQTTLLEVNNGLGVDEPTGRVIVLPNSFVFKNRVANFTHMHPFVWSKVEVTVTYETPTAAVQALLTRILEEETREEFAEARDAGRGMERHYGVPDAVYEPKCFTTLADSGVLYHLVYVVHYRRMAIVHSRISERVLAEFAKDPRMQLAYPTERHIPTPEQGSLRVTVDRPA